MKSPRVRKEGTDVGPWHGIIKGAQGNFDHLMGVIRRLVVGHNSLVDDVSDLKDDVYVRLAETATGQHTHTDVDEGHDGGAITTSTHDILEHDDANTSPTPSAGDVLTWDDTPGEWVAAAPTGGSGIEFDTEPQDGGFLYVHADSADGSNYGIDFIAEDAGGSVRIEAREGGETGTFVLRERELYFQTDATDADINIQTPSFWLQYFEGDGMYFGAQGGADLYFPEAGSPETRFAGTWTWMQMDADPLMTLDQSGNLWVLGTIDGGSP